MKKLDVRILIQEKENGYVVEYLPYHDWDNKVETVHPKNADAILTTLHKHLEKIAEHIESQRNLYRGGGEGNA